MRAKHSLRLSGRSRRIDENPGVFRQHFTIRFFRTPPAEERFIPLVAGAVFSHHKKILSREVDQVIPDPIHSTCKLIVYKQCLCVRVVEDVLDFPAHQPEVDGDKNQAGFCRRQVQLHDFRAVFHQHSDLVPLLQPQGQEAVGQSIHPFIGLGIGVAPIPLLQRHLVGKFFRIDLKILP